jgi:hypothetical protein
LSPFEARRLLENDDEERRKWSLHLFGIDTRDASLYDLVIQVKRVTVDLAVELICHAVQAPAFQTTPESQKALEELALAAQIKAALITRIPDLEVTVRNGVACLKTEAAVAREIAEMKRIAGGIPGIQSVRIEAGDIMLER